MIPQPAILQCFSETKGMWKHSNIGLLGRNGPCRWPRSHPLPHTPGTANAAYPWPAQEKGFKTVRQQLLLLTFSFETAEKWRL